jgi:hypothetical protein
MHAYTVLVCAMIEVGVHSAAMLPGMHHTQLHPYFPLSAMITVVLPGACGISNGLTAGSWCAVLVTEAQLQI